MFREQDMSAVAIEERKEFISLLFVWLQVHILPYMCVGLESALSGTQLYLLPRNSKSTSQKNWKQEFLTLADPGAF